VTPVVMIFMWISSFVIPWIAGVFLWKRDRNAVWLATPLAIVVALVANMMGHYFDFWHTTNPVIPDLMFELPVDIGLYPVTACLVAFLLRKGVNAWLVALLSAIFLTAAEKIVLLLRLIYYGHGWNLGWTFISYSLTVSVVVAYVRVVSRTKLQEP
jgi:hypothetical protein